jgi:hypothetical protein
MSTQKKNHHTRSLALSFFRCVQIQKTQEQIYKQFDKLKRVNILRTTKKTSFSLMKSKIFGYARKNVLNFKQNKYENRMYIFDEIDNFSLTSFPYVRERARKIV